MMIHRFQWGQHDAKKIYWVKWSSLCSSKSVGGMGFRDIQKFNNALLAKQVWRLVRQKDSLLFKVFRARYFLNCSVLDAPIHPKCSYAWRSILQAREVIEKGAIWRVGSGQQIEVWKHRWLSDPCYSKIITPRADSTVSRVGDLFYANTRTWDPGKLATNFYPWVAEMVSRVHVSKVCEEDLLVWPFTTDGNYSVKSAYLLLASEEGNANPSSSTITEQRCLWKKLWQIQFPTKIRYFMWRTATNSLLTKQNLRSKFFFSISETVSVLHGFDFSSFEQVFYLSNCSVFHHCLGLMAEKESAS